VSAWVNEMVNYGRVLKWEREMTEAEATAETAPPETAKETKTPRKTPDKRRNVYALINQVKLALDAGGGIQKTREAPQYQFRGIDDMYNALCRLTAEVGLTMLPRVRKHTFELKERIKDGKVVGYQTHAFVEMSIDFVSEHDLTQHRIRTVGEGIDTSDKATNKSLSAAFKYGCLMSFMIPTEGSMVDSEQDDIPVQAPKALPAPAEKPTKAEAKAAKAKVSDMIEKVSDTANRGFDNSQDALEETENLSRVIDEAKHPKLVFDMLDKVEGLPEPGYGVVKGHALARASLFVEHAQSKELLLEVKNLVLRLAEPGLKSAFNAKYAEVTR
jgi:hypothetical protein